MERKNSFVLYTDYMTYFEMLKPADRAALIMAIFAYQRDDRSPEGLSPTANIAFCFIKDQLDRDREKYEKICERNRANGAYGGRPKKTDSVTEKPKKPDNDNETDNNTDTVSDNDNDTDGLTGRSGVSPKPSSTGNRPQSGGKRKRKKEDDQVGDYGNFDTNEFFEAALRRSYEYTSSISEKQGG